MIVYEAYNKTETHQFATEKEAIDFILDDKEILKIEIEELVYTVLNSDKLEKDIQFGKTLITKFLKDNRDMPIAFTLNDNISLLTQFGPIETFSRLGDIKTVKALTSNVVVGNIFTQFRKDEFLSIINNYLINNI